MISNSKLSNMLTEKYHNIFLYTIIILLGLLVVIFSAKSPLLGILMIIIFVGLLICIYIFLYKGRFTLSRVVIPLLVASILFPPISTPLGIPNIRLELIIILIAWMLLILKNLAKGQILKISKNPIYKWFVFFGFAILLSISYSTIFKGYSIIARDFWEFGKLIEYFLIFTLVANLDISSIDIKRFYKYALIVFLCSSFIGFAQYFNIANINAAISPYYAPTQIEGLLSQGRITGTTGNPNEFGAMMVLASALAFSGVLFLRKKKLRLFLWFCLAIFCLSIVLTISRSALVALVVAVVFILFFKYPLTVRFTRYLLRLFITIFIIIIIGWVIVQIVPYNIFLRIERLKNIVSDTSWQARVVVWKYNFELVKESILFGLGPGKATMSTIVDNEWLLLLRRYGIFGVLVFVFWFASFYFGLSKIYRISPSMEVVTLVVALQATFLGYVVYMIPAAVYHSLQLMPILLLFLGLSYSQYKRKASCTNESS